MSFASPAIESSEGTARTLVSPPPLPQSGPQSSSYSPPPTHSINQPCQALMQPLQQPQPQKPSFQAYPPPPPVLQRDPSRQSFIQVPSHQLDISIAGLSLGGSGNNQTSSSQMPLPQSKQKQGSITEKALPALPPMDFEIGRSTSISTSMSNSGPRIEYSVTTSTLSDELGSYLSDQDSSSFIAPPPPLSGMNVTASPAISPPAQEAHMNSLPNSIASSTTSTTIVSIPSSIAVPNMSQTQSVASRFVSPPPPTTASSRSSFVTSTPGLHNSTALAPIGGVHQSNLSPSLVQGQKQQQHAALTAEVSTLDQTPPLASQQDLHNSLQQQQQSFSPFVQSSNYVPKSTYVPHSTFVSQSSPPKQISLPQQPQPQQQQQQQKQNYQVLSSTQQQHQQQHPYNPNASYSAPPVVFIPDQTESPSALVPSLGIPSPIHSTHPGSLVNMYRSPSPSLSTYSSQPSLSADSSVGDRMSTVSRSESSSTTISSTHRVSMSLEDGRGARQHQHIRGSSHGSSGLIPGRISPHPLQINQTGDRMKPIPTNSEDWGALVDTPASPVYERGMRQQFQGPPPFVNGSGFTDSPAAEEAGQAGDYMQHVSQHQRGRSLGYYPGHTMTDPTLTGQQRLSYQQHQQHKSASSMPTPSGPADYVTPGGNFSMAVPGNRHLHRQSWSPNNFEPLDAPLTSNSSRGGNNGNLNGYLTPPRRPDSSLGRRSHSKQNSVATSVSLLTDQAILAKYRDAANKTNDTNLQLSFAKYLLEIGEPSSPTMSAEPTSITGESASSTANIGNSTPSVAGAPDSQCSSPTPCQQQDDASNSGKKKLTQEAIYWIDRLAKEGQPEAQFIRGIWYEDGLYGNKKSADKALRCFQSASKGDFAAAHYKVGYYCEKRKDSNKAIVLYKKAATHNDVPSNFRLAMVYLFGEMGQTKNMKTGLQYLKRAATFATEEAPMAPFVLAQILAREYTQLSIPDDIAFPDDGEALEWYKKAAELDYGPANFKMGSCYEYGMLGCSIDPFLSLKYYERAVQLGDPKGEAEMALSGWFLSGAENCFDADDSKAFYYAAQAAEKGLPKAQYAMGYYFEVGISVTADLGRAMEFYRLAAAGGNKEAQARLSEQSGFDKSGHKNSIRRISNSRNAKDSNCSIM
ncbi:hypothetical protein FBU30_004445 [Linnemannia zychae]|nr:hypothetical protein FBU30_004445 [Linnemannia zychae]